MKIKLLSITTNAEKLIERYTRICYNSEDKTTEDSYIKFLPGIIKRGHISPLSFAHAVFHISEVSRAFSHQMVRHSHLRYLQRSQRYCPENDPRYVIPEGINEEEFAKDMDYVWEGYRKIQEISVKNEDARYILPNACETEMCVAGNLQSWWDFLRLRLGKHAQWEIRKVAQEIYKILNEKCPHIFNQTNLLIQPKLNLDFGE